MPQPKAGKSAKDKARDARIKELERALAEERVGVLGIAIAFLRESPSPQRLAHRLDAMARNAATNPKVKGGTKKALIEGNKLVQRALAIELEKPQPLFEPDVGPAKPEAVAEVVERSDSAGVQEAMDLGGNGDGLMDAHTERQRTLERVYEAVVAMFVEHGSMTDPELQARYMARTDFVKQSAGALRARRVELVQKGRLVRTTEQRDDKPVWDLLERAA